MVRKFGGHALSNVEAQSSRLLTAAEVAERLGFSERYVWKLGREGALPRVKVPGRKYVRFLEQDVERFVRDGRQEARATQKARFVRRRSPTLRTRF